MPGIVVMGVNSSPWPSAHGEGGLWCLSGKSETCGGSGSWAEEGNNNSHFSFSSPWCLEDLGEFNKTYTKPNSENKATHPPASTKQGLRENNNKRFPSFATNSYKPSAVTLETKKSEVMGRGKGERREENQEENEGT